MGDAVASAEPAMLSRDEEPRKGSDNLKNIEFEIVRFRHIPEDRMVARRASICRSSTFASCAAERSIFTNSSDGMKWLHEAVAK